LRIVIDILTPKQCMMFQLLEKEIQARGHQVLLTTRRYREVDEIIKRKGINAVTVGRHGGKNLRSKLIESVNRIARLVPIYEDYAPDLAVSFSSPETARTSFGLGIPHLCISDSPHAEAVSKLTIPLSKTLMTPRMIPKEAWIVYGISPEAIIQYNALDPWAWLKDFEPDRAVLNELDIETTRPLITIRSAEVFAAYLLGNHNVDSAMKGLVRGLRELDRDIQIVIIPRYREQVSQLANTFNSDVIVPERAVDGPSLLHYTDVFVGAGGTMSAEAALLGVPTISCYPGKPFRIEQFLIEKGLIEKETNMNSLVNKASCILSDVKNRRRSLKEKVNLLVEDFEDPVEVIADEIEKMENEEP